MATPREPNPLRPYYIPPSIGLPQEAPKPSAGSTNGAAPRNGSAGSYASTAREAFIDIDIDYSEYTTSTGESIQQILNDWMYKYMSVLLGQPFEVAKTVLQVKNCGISGASTSTPVVDTTRSHSTGYRDSRYADYHSDDSDQDEQAYFTSSAPSAHSYSPTRSRRRRDRSLTPERPKKAHNPSHQLVLKRHDALMEVISQEWSKEGAWGVWKGTNATFVYSFLLKTVENWSRGLIAALLNVPDPGVLNGLGVPADVIDTSYPWASLGVAVAAAMVTGLVLAPLDLIRTKLILTPISSPKRSLTHHLRTLPTYFCPAIIFVPTILHSLVTPTISHATPLLLRSYLSIDPVLTPTTYSVAKLLSRTFELFVKLPLETVLRRGQMAVLCSPPYHTEELSTMVEIGPYNGVVGTMWSIAKDEGVSADLSTSVRKGKRVEQKGQGVEGLWRGWRVGMWGLVGVWSARAMAPGGSGGEF